MQRSTLKKSGRAWKSIMIVMTQEHAPPTEIPQYIITPIDVVRRNTSSSPRFSYDLQLEPSVLA